MNLEYVIDLNREWFASLRAKIHIWTKHDPTPSKRTQPFPYHQGPLLLIGII